jgi:hypothetical protein
MLTTSDWYLGSLRWKNMKGKDLPPSSQRGFQRGTGSGASFTKLTYIFDKNLEIFFNITHCYKIKVLTFEGQAKHTIVNTEWKYWSKFSIKDVIFRSKNWQKLRIFPDESIVNKAPGSEKMLQLEMNSNLATLQQHPKHIL